MSIKRIIIVSSDYFPDIGGITTWTHNFALGFMKLGLEVIVMTKSYDSYSGKVGKVEIENGIKVIRLDHERWINNKYGKVSKAIKSYIDGETVFLCSHWKMGFACYLRSLTKKVRYFTAVHGLDALESRKKNRILQKRALKNSSGIIAVSKYTSGLLEPLKLKTPVKILSGGFDPDRFKRRMSEDDVKEKYSLNDGFKLLSLGRLVVRKGFDMTIRALKELNNPDIHYYIAGKGPFESRLRELVLETGLDNNVHFLGFIPDNDVADLYSAADLFSMPCRELPGDIEGFGLTFIEAGYCGTPSIAGKNSGAEDAVVHNKTGFLVDPDSIQDIASTIDSFIDNPELRRQMGEKARSFATENFTIERISQEAIDFFESES